MKYNQIITRMFRFSMKLQQTQQTQQLQNITAERFHTIFWLHEMRIPGLTPLCKFSHNWWNCVVNQHDRGHALGTHRSNKSLRNKTAYCGGPVNFKVQTHHLLQRERVIVDNVAPREFGKRASKFKFDMVGINPRTLCQYISRYSSLKYIYIYTYIHISEYRNQ